MVNQNQFNRTKYQVLGLYDEGEKFLSEVFKRIQGAQKKILIESYIFEICEATEQLWVALQKPLQRGVEVYLMVDGFGSFSFIEAIEQKCQQHKIKFKVFHKIYLWKNFRLLNKRNHRKTVIIDDDIAFIGSYNWSQVVWQDLAVQVQGEEVQVLVKNFFRNWSRKMISYQRTFSLNLSQGPTQWREQAQNQPLRLNTHWLERVLLWLDLLRRIRSAQNQITIVNAYFFPHRSLLRNLKKAAKRGVKIELILPSQTDAPLVQWARPLLYQRLHKISVSIFEYEPRVLHTKSLRIDDWAVVGSHNLNHRSLMHDLECEAVIQNPEDLLRLQQIYFEFKLRSRLIGPEIHQKWTWLDWLKCRVALMLKYFI